MIRIVLMALLAKDPPPSWILDGIAQVETRSYTDAEGFHYVDRRDGKAGELGPWQVTYAAYELVTDSPSWESFQALRDPSRCRLFAQAYLVYIRHHTGKPWREVIGMFNTGMHGSARIGAAYADRVVDAMHAVRP